jgi:hypothetical protein
MQIVIIILLVILVGFFLWDRLRAGQRWKEQSDIYSAIITHSSTGFEVVRR